MVNKYHKLSTVAQILDKKFHINIYMTTVRNAVGTNVRNINRVADVKKPSRSRFEDKL